MKYNKFLNRSAGIELMDDFNCTGPVVEQTLRELEVINRLLGGNKVTVSGVWALAESGNREPLSILELGCGGGDMLQLLDGQFKRENRAATFIGIDANPNIIAYASKHAEHRPTISFAAMNIFSPECKKIDCDIAIATLFLHHFDDQQLVETLSHLNKKTKLGIVINDLHRHPLAYYSIKILTQFFSKSEMVKNDGPLSVLRGFSRKEWQSILKKAGIKNYSLRWKWAFRWQIIVWADKKINP